MKQYISTNPSELYSAVLLEDLMYFISDEEKMTLYSSLDKAVQSSHYVQLIKKHLNR